MSRSYIDGTVLVEDGRCQISLMRKTKKREVMGGERGTSGGERITFARVG